MADIYEIYSRCEAQIDPEDNSYTGVILAEMQIESEGEVSYLTASWVDIGDEMLFSEYDESVMDLYLKYDPSDEDTLIIRLAEDRCTETFELDDEELTESEKYPFYMRLKEMIEEKANEIGIDL